MIHPERTAIFRMLLPFAAGIALAVNLGFAPLEPVYILPVLVLMLLIFVLSAWQRKFGKQVWFGATVACTFLALGYANTWWHTHPNRVDYYGHYLPGADSLTVQISDPPVEKARSVRLTVKVLELQNDSMAIRVMGKAYLYMAKDTAALALRYGDRLRIANRLDTLAPPHNPHEFNYKRFLTFKNIYHQAYLQEGTWRPDSRGHGLPVYARIFSLRAYLLESLHAYIESPKSRSVAAALLVGHRELLDRDTITTYASTGAMHVLAVSGLHVGIIYLLLQRLLFWMPVNTQRQKILRGLVMVTAIWGYALVTGLSPSVFRAATMFSFVIGGQSLKREVNIYTSISASAFFLLSFNPYLLTEIGFLLSYSAVLGIVYFQPKFNRLLFVPNRALNWAWQITCVSLAAQLATFPIGVLFFHQFPTYFLFSNLMVIPAASVILCLGVAMFALSWWPLAATWTGFVLDHAIRWLNSGIGAIEMLPHSLIQPLTISIPQALAIYVFILGLSGYLAHGQKQGLKLAGGMGAILLLSLGLTLTGHNYQRQLIVYRVDGNTAIDLIAGRNTTFIADSALLADADRMLFHIRHNWWNKGVRHKHLVAADTLPDGNSLLRVDGHTMLWLRSTELPLVADTVEVLLVSASSGLRPKDVAHLPFRTLVLDSSHRWYARRDWTSACEANGWHCHDVQEKGAYVRDI